MASKLAWLNFDAEASLRARKILEQLVQSEPLDELGIGGIRDTVSDALFPGTSTLQTRLRYFFFVPWLRQQVHRTHGNTNGEMKAFDRAEKELVQNLKDSYPGKTIGEGIIGVQGAIRLAGSVYAEGIRVWGFGDLIPEGADDLSDAIEQSNQRARRDAQWRKGLSADSEAPRLSSGPSVSGHFPEMPPSFPHGVDFGLRREEKEFVKLRLRLSCPSTLLADLAQEAPNVSAIERPWEIPKNSQSWKQHQEQLVFARRFSNLIFGGTLLYGWMVSEMAKIRTDDYDVEIENWEGSRKRGELLGWTPRTDLGREFKLLDHLSGHTIKSTTWEFVEKLNSLLSDGSVRLRDAACQRLILDRERIKPKSMRRLLSENERLRSTWKASRGLGELFFRWANVKRLLMDLESGSNRA